MKKRRLAQILGFLFFLTAFAWGNPDAMEQSEFVRRFDPYVGVWKGEYRIYSQKDELLNQFKVSRNYWWDGPVLMARVSYDFGGVQQTYFHRILLSEGIPFAFVTDDADSGDIRSALRGEYAKGTLIWTRVLPKESLPVRISERIVERNDERFIEFWGDQEAHDAKGNSLLVRIEGFLAYLPDSREFVVAEEAKKLQESREAEMDQPDPTPAKEVKQSETVRITATKPVTEPEKPQLEPDEGPEDRTPPEPKPEPTPDPEIQSALEEMNIVGIQDDAGEEAIVVDYFLLYEIGDRVDLDEACYFTGVDANYLYFEDANGLEYRVFRKDVAP